MASKRISTRAMRVALVFCFAVVLCGSVSGLNPLSYTGFYTGSGSAEAKMARDTVWLVTGGKEYKIDAEIAATLEDASLGLMYRTELPENEGMLFPSQFPREISMWMRNTYIPLDMLFIREDGIIHRIEAMTEPHSEAIISSKGAVAAVLELKGGSAARLGLIPGDLVRHRTFGNAK